MNVFGYQTNSLWTRSEEALGAFTKAIDNLKKINKEAVEERLSNENKIKIIQFENNLLGTLEAENNKVISKIESIIK
jgi:hypothetical protein